MHIYLAKSVTNTWTESSSDWVRWMDSAPIFKPPPGVEHMCKLTMAFEWVDQGYGNRKGSLKIELVSVKGEVLATEQVPQRADHKWSNVDITYDDKSGLISEAVNGSFYRVSIVTGGGGGHTLTVKDFSLSVHIDVFHEIAFPNEKMVQELGNAQGASRAKPAVLKAQSIPPCTLAIGWVVFDVVCLAIGGVGLRAGAEAEVAVELAEAVAPAIPKIVRYCKDITRAGVSLKDKAWAVFGILSTIFNGGMGGAVVGVFLDSLTWYDALLYGATAMTTIVAAVATDGVAFVAEVALVLATFTWLVEDSIKAVNACS